MELEKFEQAKKIKEDLDRLERQKHKLESALQSCSLGVTIEFRPSKAFPSRKDEVSVYSKDAIKEMISKELERLNSEIELVKEEFEKV
jgi:archaellum component FlaC